MKIHHNRHMHEQQLHIVMDDLELAQRIYDAVSKGWFMFASPVLSNAPMPGQKARALPISCFLTYVPDSLGRTY